MPLHPLVAHAAVVFVPLAALGTILTAAWPAAGHRFWPAVLLVATLALVAVPLATSSGHTLEEHVGQTPQIEAHMEQGERVLPYVIVLWLAAAGVSALHITIGRSRRGVLRRGSKWRSLAAVTFTALAHVGGLGGTAWTVLAGHSGAKAVWK